MAIEKFKLIADPGKVFRNGSTNLCPQKKLTLTTLPINIYITNSL